MTAAGAAFDIDAQVLACMRRIVGPQVLYNTDFCQIGWTDNNFIHLATELEICFRNAGHPIAKAISRPDMTQCCTVSDICDVVRDAFS